MEAKVKFRSRGFFIIAISTLRYYDREGMFPNIELSNEGIRVFLIRRLTRLE